VVRQDERLHAVHGPDHHVEDGVLAHVEAERQPRQGAVVDPGEALAGPGGPVLTPLVHVT
jgi:hypothetical protein